MDFAQIYEGWKNKLIPSENMKELITNVSKARLEICSTCSFQSEVRKREGKYKSVRPDVHCTNCGCTLSAKTACLSCNCPINLWEAIATDDQQEHIENEIDGQESIENQEDISGNIY